VQYASKLSIPLFIEVKFEELVRSVVNHRETDEPETKSLPAAFDIVAIASSAGGLKALIQVLSQVKQAEAGDRLMPGMVYIAPPNYHLLVNPDRSLSLTQSELVHFLRPSADLMFESVAATYKDRAIAVVLSGTGSDGALGVEAIHEMGGTAISQDQETSEYFGMPSAAIRTGAVDLVLPLSDIAPTLIELTMHTSDPHKNI
jgi:two-component system, chemotaxis family, protein-glutamate methylesterase/glutaminase